MVKDVRLYLEEAKALGVPVDVAETIGRLWEATAREQGPDSDFTAVIKPFENAAGVTVGQKRHPPESERMVLFQMKKILTQKHRNTGDYLGRWLNETLTGIRLMDPR